MGKILMLILCLSLLLVGCAGSAKSEDTVQVLYLRDNIFLVIENSSNKLSRKNNFILFDPEDQMELTTGRLYNLTLAETPDNSELPQVKGELALLEENLNVMGISFSTVKNALDNFTENIYLIDVRTKEEFASGHIPQASNLPLSELADKAETMIPDKSAIIMVYCRSGRRSAQAAAMLQDLGYRIVLDAGGVLFYNDELGVLE